MNRFDLFRSIGEVDEKLLARSEVRDRRRPGRSVWVTAASFALCIGILGLALMLTGTPGHSSGAPTTPRFFISAYAEDGSLMNLSQNDRCNTGLPTDKNRFDTDYPMFCFYLNHGNWDKEKQLGENVEIVVSYNGNVVWMGGAQDPHLQLYYNTTDDPFLSDLYLEKVVGWFAEPTDLVFAVQKTLWGADGRPEKTITLETFTVNVCYIARTNNYRLTVTDVQEGNP